MVALLLMLPVILIVIGMTERKSKQMNQVDRSEDADEGFKSIHHR